MNYEERLQDLLDELDLFQDWTERYEYIISLGKKLPRLDEAYKTEDSLIKGCQSRVWLHTEPDNGVLKLYADSDSLITKGLIAVFIRLLSGLPPEEIRRLAALQKTILENASHAVKPGGRLVYSTCSIDAEEDGLLVRDFLQNHPEWTLKEEKLILPHEEKSGGAYAALLICA